jgi:serine/threonine-protein kinase
MNETQEVLGGYRLIGELSSGGMGTVYRAQHEVLGRYAAIKLLRPELSNNDVLVQRFFNEAKAATAIRHRGIVQVYDFGYTEDGRAYFVMELLDGEPLSKRIASRGRLTEAETVAIARGIASALTAAHAKGIVHRDLKPDNVFLVPDRETGDVVKVLDFGVAKLGETLPGGPRHTQTGVLMGTPLYMAPEQARAAGSIDQRADLYSLGCIMYELLTGKPPFVATGAGEIIAMQLFDEARRPSDLVAEVTPQMSDLVMRLLAKEPHERYQTAEEVLQVLRGETRSIIPPTPYAGVAGSLRFGMADHEPQPAAKKSALPIVAGVVTVVLAAAVAIFALSRGGDDRPAPAPAVAAPSPAPPAPPAKPAVVVAPPAPVPAPAADEDPIVAVEAGKPAIVAPPKRPKQPAVKLQTTQSTTTHPQYPGMHTDQGAPIEVDLGPTKKGQ